MSLWSNIARLWEKERSVEPDDADGLLSLVVKATETVSDLSALVSVHITIGRTDVPRQFASLEAMGGALAALANGKDVEENLRDLTSDWKALQKPILVLLKSCVSIGKDKDASETAKGQCRAVSAELPALVVRMDALVKKLASVPRHPGRKAA